MNQYEGYTSEEVSNAISKLFKKVSKIIDMIMKNKIIHNNYRRMNKKPLLRYRAYIKAEKNRKGR